MGLGLPVGKINMMYAASINRAAIVVVHK